MSELEENSNIHIEQELRVWVCPDCGFTMDAVHTDEEDGTYSCPNCTEAELTERLNEATTALEVINDCLFGNTHADRFLEEAYKTAHDFLAKKRRR